MKEFLSPAVQELNQINESVANIMEGRGGHLEVSVRVAREVSEYIRDRRMKVKQSHSNSWDFSDEEDRQEVIAWIKKKFGEDEVLSEAGKVSEATAPKRVKKEIARWLADQYKDYKYGDPQKAAERLVSKLRQLEDLVASMNDDVYEAGDALSPGMMMSLKKDITNIVSANLK